MKKTLTVLGAIVTSLTVFAGVSQALPANDGYGWKVKVTDGVPWGLKHNTKYKIRFVNQDSRIKSQPYLTNAMKYLNNMSKMESAGISFVMVNESYGLANYNEKDWCGNDFGTFTFITKTSPTADEGESVAHSCVANGWATGGYAVMDSDYWKVSPSHERTKELANIHAHELGHMLGLGHPSIAGFPSGSLIPVMYGNPVGGYQSWESAGKYTSYDVGGLHRLISNGS